MPRIGPEINRTGYRLPPSHPSGQVDAAFLIVANGTNRRRKAAETSHRGQRAVRRERQMFARNRSRNLSILGALAGAMLVSTAALAQVSDDVVRIGVLTDMNGPASTPTGQGSVTAAQMAIDDFGGKVLGKPISLIVGDHQLKPDIGGGNARRWDGVDQVVLIVDIPGSSGGRLVMEVRY